MKNYYVLMLIIPICFCIEGPWEWDIIDYLKDIVDDVKEKISTNIPLFIVDVEKKLEDFKSYAEEKKTEIIVSTQSKIEDLYEKIKTDHKTYIKPLIENATELAKYITYKICDTVNMDYVECRQDKKKVMSKLLDKLKDELQCSQIISLITTHELSDDLEENLKYILFLMNSIISSPDSIEFGKRLIIKDALICLQEKFDEYFPKILEKITGKPTTYNVSLKIDVIKLLVDSISKLVNIIHYEELDGFIEKINEKTGLISDERVKKIQNNIFEISKKLFEFGTQFYNINNKLSINITVNPGKLGASSDIEYEISDYKTKGIKIALHSKFMLRIAGAHFLNTLVFDSPLISVKKDISVGGTSNTFVSITLYDKDGKEIKLNDINVNKPIIYFKKKIFGAMKTCLFYNEEEDKLENSGIETQTETFDGEEYIKCIPKHLTSFTIGTYYEEQPQEKPESSPQSSNIFVILLICFIVIIAILAIIIGYIYIRRNCCHKKVNINDIESIKV
jgi:hypothetical protein